MVDLSVIKADLKEELQHVVQVFDPCLTLQSRDVGVLSVLFAFACVDIRRNLRGVEANVSAASARRSIFSAMGLEQRNAFNRSSVSNPLSGTFSPANSFIWTLPPPLVRLHPTALGAVFLRVGSSWDIALSWRLQGDTRQRAEIPASG